MLKCARVELNSLFCVLSPQDPGYATFLFEQLQRPASHEAGASSCHVCSTPLHQLRQEALQGLHAPTLTFSSDMAASSSTSYLPQPARFALSSSGVKPLPRVLPSVNSLVPLGERHRAPGGPQSTTISSASKTSVQVTVAGGQLGGSLGSVTIQAQQYLEGMWSISKVNTLLPQSKPVCHSHAAFTSFKVVQQ